MNWDNLCHLPPLTEGQPPLPGKRSFPVQGPSKPKHEAKINEAPALGSREMLGYVSQILLIPILEKPSRQVRSDAVQEKEIPNGCLEVEVHGKLIIG